MSKNINLGSFIVDVELQPNGKLDVYMSHEGSFWEHYTDVDVDDLGELVEDLVECVAEYITEERTNHYAKLDI